MRAWYAPIRTPHGSRGPAIDPWEQMGCGSVPAPGPLPEYQRENSLTPSPYVMQSQRLRDSNCQRHPQEEGLGQKSLPPKGAIALVSASVHNSLAASQQLRPIKLKSEPHERGPATAGADPFRYPGAKLTFGYALQRNFRTKLIAREAAVAPATEVVANPLATGFRASRCLS